MTAVAPDVLLPAEPLASAWVGMVGGGPIARMTHQAAVDLGINLEILARSADDPAVLAGARHLLGPSDSLHALRLLADRCEVLTLDDGQVPAEHLSALQQAGYTVRPRPEAVSCAQDRYQARRLLKQAGFAVVPSLVVEEGGEGVIDAVRGFGEQWGWPLVMQARRPGSDRRVTHLVQDLGGSRDLFAARPPGGWGLEAHLPDARELTVLVARRSSGETAVYPVVETLRHEGMRRELVMPARVPADIAAAATRLAKSVADGIDATGILAVELFLTSTGELLVGELALRPHRSGLATVEATVASQFHNHLRGVLDWPLGSTEMTASAAATVDVVGASSGADPARYLPAALAVPGARVHLYGHRARPGRTLGHVTAVGGDQAEALDTARAAARLLLGP